MSEKFEIKINSFGLINNTIIDFNKINIVAGDNSTGKSFSSKLLFSFLLTFSKKGLKIANNGVKVLFEDIITKIEREPNIIKNKTIVLNKLKLILNEWDNYIIDYKYFNDKLSNFKKLLVENIDFFAEDFNKINNVVEFHKENDSYIKQLIYFLLNSEFENSQISDFGDIDVDFLITGKEFSINYNLKTLNNDLIITPVNVEGISNIKLNNVIYLSTLTPMDLGNHDLPYEFNTNSEYLIKKNNNGKNIYDSVYDKKLNEFSKEISNIIGGNFVYDSNREYFVFKNNGKTYDLFNVASGHKQIGMLQVLLDNKILNENCILILDEVEVNLHPNLQIKFAEILIRMVKELNLKLYINSHSPLFIEAMEVLTVKYDLVNDTKFYLSRKNGNGDSFKLENILRKNISRIYANLANPYDIIEDIEVENLAYKKFGF